MSKARLAHIIFKKENKPNANLAIDRVYGSEDKAYERLSILKKWGYEVKLISLPMTHESQFGDGGFAVMGVIE